MWLLILACHSADPKSGDDTAPTGPPTPEQVVAEAADGETVEVRGTVHTLTFDSELNGDPDEETEEGEDAGPWQRLPGRWLLVRSEVPEGVRHDELEPGEITDDATVLRGWTLGVALDDDAPRADIGDEVDVRGTFRWSTWNGHPVPVVEDATVEVLAPAWSAGVGEEGAACTHDEDCAEQLVCDRATAACAPPAETGWGSAWRDVDGSCASDADCPLGQFCDTSFVVPDSGDYTWRYDGASKSGRSLCVPEEDDPDAACPRVWTPRDLAGGRFAEGREVCVEGEVQFITGAPDGDTHVQLLVDEPIPYPMMDAHVWLFGATTEIGPPYKNPDRPQGGLEDPAVGQRIRVLGTMRWDDTHGWYEVHPVKRWWPVDARR